MIRKQDAFSEVLSGKSVSLGHVGSILNLKDLQAGGGTPALTGRQAGRQAGVEAGSPTEGPSWGYPVFVLGAVCSFLCGNIVKS